jgi:anti-sigma factor RsiW
MTTTTDNQPPDSVEDLLPWYAKGRISAADRQKVEAALRGDAELRRRLQLVREEMESVSAAYEALPGPPRGTLDRIMAGIAAEPVKAAPLAALKRGLMDRIGDMIAALSPRTLAYATTAAAAVIVVQGLWLTGALDGGRSPQGYQTASAPGVSAGTFVMVAFAPAAPAADVAALMQRLNASIVDGPRASGLYRVRIGDAGMAKADVDRVVDTLRRERGIIATVALSN